MELLVVGTRTCTDSTMDLRNWIFDDHNGWYGGSGTGIAAGHFRFTDDVNWERVPYGSIILIYNNGDRNLKIPAGSDDPTDANDDLLYVLPINSTYLEHNLMEPVSPSSTNYVYPNSGYATPIDWVPVGLANGGDAVIIVDPANKSTAHFSIQFGFTLGSGAQTPTVNLGPVASGANAYVSADQYMVNTGWTIGIANTAEETPGAPNTADNANWIATMRASGGSGITISFTTIAPTCTVATGSITVTAPVGASYTYSIDGVNFQSSPVFNNIAPGNYTITVDDGSACNGTISASVADAPETPAAPVFTVVQPTCAIPSGEITITSPVGAEYAYSIDGTNFQTTTTFTGLTPGDYTVTVRNTASCSATSTVNIATPPSAPAAPTVNSPVTYCVGETAAALSATGTDLLWYTNATGGTGSATAPTPSTATAGTTSYYVSQTVTGCESPRAEIQVVVTSVTLEPISGNTSICGNGTSQLSNTTPAGSWASSNVNVATVDNNGLVTAIAPGTTSITYSVGTGVCASSVSVTITVIDFEMNLSASATSIPQGTSVTLTPSSTQTYTVLNWLPQTAFTDLTATVQTITPTATQVYEVVGQNADGCIDTASVTITVIAEDEEIFIPNAFTPNGDGRNDLFTVYGNSIQGIEMIIFNQWGEKIFETNNPQGWNGEHRGKKQPSGVYVYVINVTMNSGQLLKRKGSVNLVR